MFLLSGLSVGVRTKLCVLVSLHALFYRYFQKTDLVPMLGACMRRTTQNGWQVGCMRSFLTTLARQ